MSCRNSSLQSIVQWKKRHVLCTVQAHRHELENMVCRLFVSHACKTSPTKNAHSVNENEGIFLLFMCLPFSPLCKYNKWVPTTQIYEHTDTHEDIIAQFLLFRYFMGKWTFFLVNSSNNNNSSNNRHHRTQLMTIF